jgi:hypothetical protein
MGALENDNTIWFIVLLIIHTLFVSPKGRLASVMMIQCFVRRELGVNVYIDILTYIYLQLNI